MLSLSLIFYKNNLKFMVSTYSIDKTARVFMLVSQLQVTSTEMAVELL
jgi:hypothetical protein